MNRQTEKIRKITHTNSVKENKNKKGELYRE